ncbi:MAG: group III truncated hemoglobin [Bdellovibrionales bacterium]|nr:group III truncated hemoglobin [Bdellovibrionales bacterium]
MDESSGSSSDSHTKSKGSVTVAGVAFSHAEIFSVVDDFYHRIENDPVLRVPFRSVGDWPYHIERLAHFWWIRFGGTPYLFNHYNPVPKHFFAGFNSEFLARWLGLFRETIEAHLRPEQSEVWNAIAERMGDALSLKNEQFRNAIERTRDERRP